MKILLFIAISLLGIYPAQIAGAPEIYTTIVIKKEQTLFEKMQLLDGTHGGQCVEFIQRYFETFYTHPGFRGVAGNIKPNASEPEISGVVLENNGPKGHVALIIEIEGDDLILAESNYKNDGIINVGRRLNIHSERIVGYFNF